MNRKSLVSFLSSVVVLIIGLLIGLIILLISNHNQALPAFMRILTFGSNSMRNIGDVLLSATPYIFTGLSVAFAYRTGLFNIGATGQFTIGSFSALYVAINFTFIPSPLRIFVAILAAALAGGLWGSIPGFLKAYRNVHEVISCIMLNYIGMFFANFLIVNTIFDEQFNGTILPPADTILPNLGMNHIFSDRSGFSRVNIGILIAIGVALLIYVILEKTTFGYELKACGFNRDAAKYAGINENRNIILSMSICGALAGIGGALFYMNGTGVRMLAVDALAPQGFIGISVAFLAMNNPIGVIFSGILISYLYAGGSRMQMFGFSSEFVEIVIAIIIYFCAFVFLTRSWIEKNLGFKNLASRLNRKTEAKQEKEEKKGSEETKNTGKLNELEKTEEMEETEEIENLENTKNSNNITNGGVN